jgi:cholesterol transport system auxiliary component
MRNRIMERRIFLAGAAALALSGCGSDLIGPPEAGQIYPVSPRFPSAPPDGAGPKVGWALSIARPDVAGGMAGDRIALFQPGGTQDFYADATYPDRLPSLIQRALLDGFETSGRIDAVAREQDALHADYQLLTEVKDFAAHYAVQDGVPTMTVAITAKLATAHGRKIVATLAVTHSASAGANSTAAATQALSGLLGQCVSEIVAWALSQPAPTTQPPDGPNPRPQ